MAFLSSWLERPTQVAPYWRAWHFDPLSSLFNAKWHEWLCNKFSWWNDMKWYIKWRDMWCNAWNAWCSWNTKCATCVTCVRCMWCVQWNVWNMTWNDVKCNMKWREMQHEMMCDMKWHKIHAMQIVDFGYMQRDVTLIFDRDHNLIILFLILLRIWVSVLMWN